MWLLNSKLVLREEQRIQFANARLQYRVTLSGDKHGQELIKSMLGFWKSTKFATTRYESTVPEAAVTTLENVGEEIDVQGSEGE